MINCEKEPEMAKKAGVNSYPQFKLRDGNNVMKNYEGKREKNSFIEYIKRNLSM